MNTFSAALYNNLPSIGVANRSFTDRDKILSNLETLFKDYKHFGVCLVHRHCILEEGERMVADDKISQPERVKDSECYPERWLVTGEAYEFNRKETISPPQKLLEEFRTIVGDVKVLGLFYAYEREGGIALERTEGRRNIIEIVPHHTPRRALTTAWLPGQAFTDNTMKLYECASCKIANNSHIENVDKMDGLERRRDLGHEILWLRGDQSDGNVRAV